MRNWKKIVGMLLIMAVWLGLMWRLSTENGTETLKDSMRFARKFGAWIYGEPTAAQLDHSESGSAQDGARVPVCRLWRNACGILAAFAAA